MAGEILQEIYCWETRSGALTIYFASTKAGALRIGLAMGNVCDSLAYFGKIFPKAMLFKEYDFNRSLVLYVGSILSNRPFETNLANIEMDFTCTPFQWKVFGAIRTIPFGETKTYQDVARMVGKPKAARAVGQALRRNPLPVIFP